MSYQVENLKNYLPILPAVLAALRHYVVKRPDHVNGLCCWLRDDQRIGRQADGSQADEGCVYNMIADYRPAGDNRCYVDQVKGPTETRVAFAQQLIADIAALIEKPAVAEPLPELAEAKFVPKYHINLKKATLQRIFEFGLRHGRLQKVKSSDEVSNCSMRGTGGVACIVGAMIDDDLAAQCDGSELSSVPCIDEAHWNNLLGGSEKKAKLLSDMQQAHDSAASHNWLPEFEANMEKVALKHGLTYKAPGTTLRA